jgi:uncharacterized protein (TIGR03437 family)
LQTTLGGVQVTIDGTAIPLYSISPAAITAIVPYTAKSDGSVVTIIVNNNAANSNPVQRYTGVTSPGVFTLESSGIGDGAVLHSNNTVVNSKSPAQHGEIISIYLSGAGTASGAARPFDHRHLQQPSDYRGQVAGTTLTSTEEFEICPNLSRLYRFFYRRDIRSCAFGVGQRHPGN